MYHPKNDIIMKKILLILLLFGLYNNCNVFAQKKATSKSQPLVTKSMAEKISNECLYGSGYGLTVFYSANSELLSYSDILAGKGREILYSLEKYPKYSENFIYGVYERWGYSGLKDIGFTSTELERAKKVIKKRKDSKP